MSPRTFTVEELAKHDGSDSSLPVLLCVQGMVYDVTPGKDFYGPGGPYQVFAGKECARALALMSTSADDCKADVSDLPDDKLRILKDWERKFQGKYRVLGALKGSGLDVSSIQAQQSLPEPHEPTGHNRPLLLSLAAFVVAALAVAMTLAASKSG